ncbi:MAG: pyridoxamine 5'-phosphate oxidase family protein [Parashewanella sp.]
MGQVFEQLTDKQVSFIEKQQMFFVATAMADGTVNLSPKGIDSFRIIDNNTIAWLNLTGSGNETATHLQQNTRMTIMFCAFEGAPLILRLYGQATMLHQADEKWQQYMDLFPVQAGARQVFILNIDKTQDSCGYGVPLFDYVGQRETLVKSHARKGQQGIEAYWKKANQVSFDGLPTHILELSGVAENKV